MEEVSCRWRSMEIEYVRMKDTYRGVGSLLWQRCALAGLPCFGRLVRTPGMSVWHQLIIRGMEGVGSLRSAKLWTFTSLDWSRCGQGYN